MRPDHTYDLIRPPGFEVQIDRHIRPLIEKLWQLGYRTYYCCQGDGPDPLGKPGHIVGESAYIVFGSMLEASLFIAFAGPVSWSKAAVLRERAESEEIAKAWAKHKHKTNEQCSAAEWYRINARQRWERNGDSVYFPGRDIGRALAALTTSGIRVSDLLGAYKRGPDESAAAPALCGFCRGPIISRRKDARYCCTRCRLRARNRKQVAVDV